MSFVIACTVIDRNGVALWNDTPEYLGEAYGEVYASREEAESATAELRATIAISTSTPPPPTP